MVRMLMDNDLGGIRGSPGVTQWALGQGYVVSRFPAQPWGLPAGEGVGLSSHCWVAVGGVLALSGLGFPICGWRGGSPAAGRPSRALPSVPHTLCQSSERWTRGRAGVSGGGAAPPAPFLAGAHAVARDRGQPACAREGARGRGGARRCGYGWTAACPSRQMYVVRVDGVLPACPQVSERDSVCAALS